MKIITTPRPFRGSFFKPEKQPKAPKGTIRRISLKKQKENPQGTSRISKRGKAREVPAGEKFTNSTIKKKPYKATGELVVFKMIWEERPHICQVTGDPVLEFDPWCFMHLLAKKPFPKFRLRKDNIWLVTRFVHGEYDNGDRSHEMFNEARGQAEKLKLEYYSNKLALPGKSR